jgi:hypothetical protein
MRGCTDAEGSTTLKARPRRGRRTGSTAISLCFGDMLGGLHFSRVLLERKWRSSESISEPRILSSRS